LQIGGNLLNLSGVSSGTTGARLNANGGGMLRLASGGVDALYVIDGGNVGIGTTSPAAPLDVVSTLGSTGVNIRGRSADNIGSLYFTSNADASTEYGFVQGRSTDLRISGFNNGLILQPDSGNVGIGDTSPVAPLTIKGRGTFSINNTDFTMGNNLYYDSVSDRWERLTASAGAAVYLTGGMLQFYNTTAGGATGDLVTTTQRFQINSSGRQAYNGSATANAHCNLVGALGAANRAMSFENTVGGGECGTVTTTASTTSYNTTSDYRLKENVVPMTGSIDRVKALKPSRFNFIVDADKTVDGFLAHEAQEVVPECVTGTKDAMRDEEYEVTPAVLDDDGTVVTEAVMGTRSVPDYQGIDQSKLVPLLTAALQEAITKIEDLTTRLETLENA
jgi:hypothetical protein